MTIRYKCDECGSVLKIKDELAGTDGKCPKCKRKFVIPAPAADVASDVLGDVNDSAPLDPPREAPTQEPVAAAATDRTPARKSAPPPAKKKPAAHDDDFDPMAVLMDDAGPGAKASAGLLSPPPEAAKPAKPAVDAQGRRRIIAPPPPTTAGGPAAAASAASMLNASANANDLLTKAREEGRAKAGSMPDGGPRRKRVNLNLRGLGPQLIRSAPIVVGVIVLIYMLYWISDYMMSSKLPLPALARVSGSVTLNGDPLVNVKVLLTPVSNQGKDTKGRDLRLRTAEGVTDDTGYYTVEYMSGVPGAPIGKVRISVEAMNPADFKRLPPQYTQPGNDIREVKEAANEGKFNLELKTQG